MGGGCIRSPGAARSSGESEGHLADSPSLNPTSWLSNFKHVFPVFEGHCENCLLFSLGVAKIKVSICL